MHPRHVTIIYLRVITIALLGGLVMASASCRNAAIATDHISWTDSVTEHFRNLMNVDNPSRALNYIDSVFKAAPKRGIGDNWRRLSVKVEYYTTIAYNAKQQQLLIDSMQALLTGRTLQYKYEYAHNLFLQGDLFQAEKKYPQAFQCYYDGRNFARQNLDNCSLSDFSNCLANVYYNQGAYNKAIQILKQSFSECTICATSSFQYQFTSPQAFLNTIGLCFEKGGKPDSAAAYYIKALNFIDQKAKNYPEKEVFISTARAVIQGNLGGLYSRQHKYDEAIKYMQQSIKNNDREKYAIEDAQLTKIKLATLYIRLSRFSEAEKLISQLHQDLLSGRGKSLAHAEVTGKWYRLNWLFYDTQRKIPEAYKFQSRYYAYNDSISQNKNNLKNANLDQAFRVHDQQFQLAMLNKNDELKTAYLAVVILFLILAITISLITYIHLKRSRKNINALTGLNGRMKNTLAALENSQADNSRMMAIVAHDLRNPIGAITTAATFMLDDNAHTADDTQLLKLIKTSGKHSLKLVNDLLLVNTGPGQPEKEPINLHDLLQYCVDLLRHRATDKKQQILLNSETVMVTLNQEKMWRVISNLVANAIKFSPEETVITVRLEQNEQGALITVKDQGMGIPEEIKDKIFGMFTNAKRTGTAGEESFGLGLSIAKQIVEDHGGSIWFESIEGQGATFFVRLPME